ncbi:MAG: metalloregulator ArsR/SmtB family transcription factor [Rhodothermales bacterium]
MVEYNDDILDELFGALSDATRRAILEQLLDGPATVGELAEPHDITFQGVSKHVRKLERAGLVRRCKDGREVRCELRIERLRPVSSWIDEQRRFWTARLDRLGEVLDAVDQENAHKERGKTDGTTDD